jgi:hypothetical protein
MVVRAATPLHSINLPYRRRSMQNRSNLCIQLVKLKVGKEVEEPWFICDLSQ